MSNEINQAGIIRNNIKRLRIEKGWNQSKLAKEAGIPAATISKIENEYERIPTIIILNKISLVLRVKINEIIEEKRESSTLENEKKNKFYEKWGLIDNLTNKDKDLLLSIIERLIKV